MRNRFEIGTKFVMVGRKDQTEWEVVDILTTTNSKGEVVKIRYSAKKIFCGQELIDNDVLETTIARGFIA